MEVAELSKFVVAAREGEAPGGSVAGAFTVNVLPADAFGNASMKIDNTVGSEAYKSVAVTFSSSHAAVTVPGGVHMVPAGGADFGAVAADMDGSATIAVRTVARDLVTGTGADAVTGAFSGSVTVRFAPEGGPGRAAPAAPASIEVQDYMGADGRGDQGGLVLIGFPEPARNDDVIRYLIEREIETTLEGYDENGNEGTRRSACKEMDALGEHRHGRGERRRNGGLERGRAARRGSRAGQRGHPLGRQVGGERRQLRCARGRQARRDEGRRTSDAPDAGYPARTGSCRPGSDGWVQRSRRLR